MARHSTPLADGGYQQLPATPGSPLAAGVPIPPLPSGTLFATKNNTKVTAQRGGTALLPCTVLSQPAATVSWIRRQDFQLLTVGLSTYSSDERFMVAHLRHWGLWALRIKSVRAEDEGVYECQLSVHPVQSVFVELKVVEAEAEIVGAPDLHIDEGSTLRLECKLQRATENPTFVF
ncbi:muscle, skeletal receptor tyrosine protein kinase-like, partial [Anopheles bellator]|uniref:muscle, skeletal receptor tyrosine protein kinase-like n=1 Tax=Anopheles bellator TaxID=139047 RepID=UPI002647AB8C